MGSEYIYPYGSNRIMSDFILELPGGKKLGESYVKTGVAERKPARTRSCRGA